MKGMVTKYDDEWWEILGDIVASSWDGESTLEVPAMRISDNTFNLLEVGKIDKIYHNGKTVPKSDKYPWRCPKCGKHIGNCTCESDQEDINESAI